MAAKGGRTVSVVPPALNEAETVGGVIETIIPMLGGLVDELIVLDSGSTDATEARAVAALDHPHILALHDFGTQDGTLYAVFELLEGQTLRQRIAGARPCRRRSSSISR